MLLEMLEVLKSNTDFCHIITALFIIAKDWKQPKCPSAAEWISQLWYIHTMEYYPTIKNELLIQSSKWITLKRSFLSEISPIQRLHAAGSP